MNIDINAHRPALGDSVVGDYYLAVQVADLDSPGARLTLFFYTPEDAKEFGIGVVKLAAEFEARLAVKQA